MPAGNHEKPAPAPTPAIKPMDNASNIGASTDQTASMQPIAGAANSFLNQFKSFTQNPFSSVGNFFKGQIASTQPALQTPFYQVKPGDTLQTIGLNPQSFMNANNGVKTLPPPGSFIATGAQSPRASRNTIPAPTPYTSEGGMNRNYTGNPLQSNSSLSPSLSSNNYRGNPLGGMAAPLTDAQIAQEVKSINFLYQSNSAPSSISFQTAAARGETPQSMVQQGWTQNFVTGQWVPAAAARNNWVAPNNTTNAPGGRGNRSGGSVRNAHGSLMGGHGGHRGEEVAAAVTPMDNAGDTGSTTLGLQIGSG